MTLLLWLTTLLTISVVFLPFTIWWGKRLYLFGAPISALWGTLLISITAWTGLHLHLFSNTREMLISILCVSSALNLLLLYKNSELVEIIRSNLKKIVVSQLLFFIPFILWAVLRGFNPAIDNFEKFMDMNFLSASYRTEYLPAQDPWFAGETINYYYFGHFIAATVTKLSGVSPEFGYNFAVASVFGWSWSTAFIVGATLYQKISKNTFRAWRAGALSAFLVTLGGTLYSASFLFKEDLESLWFYYSIRLIPNAIHEMPGYSFVVSDLHGHLTNIPHVLLATCCILVISAELHAQNKIRLYATTALSGICLGIIFMTSLWDLPIYLGLTGVVIFSILLHQKKSFLSTMQHSVPLALIIIISVISTVSLFFSHFDTSIAQGIGIVHAHTSVKHFLILWGPQYFVFATVVLLWWRKKLSEYDSFWLTVFVSIGQWATLLLLIPEIIYIKDIYGADMHRLNTILKFYYQVYILLAIVMGVGINLLWTKIIGWSGKIWKTVVFVFLIGILAYPLQIIPNFYQEFANFQGWNGIAYMKYELESDRPAIEWINTHISGQPVMVEAAGDSYTQFNRISTFTGLPTIQGWMVHEWLWRGSYELPQQRTADVKTLYETENSELRQTLFEKYQVKYVYIGDLERSKYPNLQLDLLQQTGQTVYKNQGVEIIEIE